MFLFGLILTNWKKYVLSINGFSVLSLLLYLHTSYAWLPDIRPDLNTKLDIIIAKFNGNTSDNFKILGFDEATLLVGASDILYNISFNGLHEISRLEWHSSDADRELCALKGKHENDCHNYLRVFAQTATDQILLCGTNSYKPRCRHYTIDSRPKATTKQKHYELIKDMEAQGLCPYSPSHNSTYIFTGGQLYSATVADFSGSDPLIYREILRTEQYDLKQLNKPDFVGAVEWNEYVFFFFREISMEYMNCGKAVYSRVGRVCKNDRGGPYTLSKSWTSFLKARLNCSVPGEYPFYFDEIQAVSGIIGSGVDALIYAVFTTSINAISGSAVCAFRIEDILLAFEGRFKSQKDSQSNWLPINIEEIPEPRPGMCVDDSRTLSSTAVNFVKNHPFMEMAVPAKYNRPVFTKVNLDNRLTAVTVDYQVKSLSGDVYDVIYVGSDDGKITKFINIPLAQTDEQNKFEQTFKTVVISERQVLPMGTAVRELLIAKKTNTLVVVSDGSVLTVPLYNCANNYECQSCLSSQDPNCAWDLQNHECIKLGSNKFGTKSLVQSLNTTKKAAAALCPKIVAHGGLRSNLNKIGTVSVVSTITTATDKEIIDDTSRDLNREILDESGIENVLIDSNKLKGEKDPNGDSVQARDMTGEHRLQLAGKSFYWGFAIVVLALVFIIGMVVGLYTSRRMCTANTFHTNHRNKLSTTRPCPTTHHRNSGKDVNLLVNTNIFVPCNQKKANVNIVGEKDRSHECKNSTENLEKEIPCKTSTLTKVKRTYI